MLTRKFHPLKYYRGLSTRKKQQRRKEIVTHGSKGWKNPRAYTAFKTDSGVKTKTSGYTEAWYKRFPEARSLEEKAKASGVPLRFLRESYNRGMAAWRTGHRPGATQQQWGYARVHSFLLCGKTHYSTDSDIVKRAKKEKDISLWNSC
jgi:hypothetical protein